MKNEVTPSGFIPARVVHLHPSKFCNLACKHCYSASGPTEKGMLDASKIVDALKIFWQEGYEVLSLSGGEPLLYTGFETVVQNAVELGYQVNLITNGAQVGGRNLEIISNYVHAIAVSLDGAPQAHIEMRGNKSAFAHVERALERLSKTGVIYGVSYCVSQESLADMPWALDFAQENHAKLLQFHPFAPTGRGEAFAEKLSLSDSDLARAFVISKLLASYSDLKIQLDIAAVANARERRQDYQVLSVHSCTDRPLADFLSPIVVDSTGTVLPFSYGINPELAIAHIGDELAQSIETYKEQGWLGLKDFVNHAFAALHDYEGDFIDWFYHLVKVSYTQTLVH